MTRPPTDPAADPDPPFDADPAELAADPTGPVPDLAGARHAPPDLFDDALYARRQAQASDPLFHRLAADELCDRLTEVNRSFTRVLMVTHQPGPWRQALAAHPSVERFEVVTPAPTLPIERAAFDLVVLGLWLHTCNDPLGALIQARLALKPDGLLLAALFGGQTLHELRDALAEAEIAETGGLSPRVAPMAEIRELGNLVQRAGLVMPVADATRTVLRHQTALSLMQDLRRMGETSVLAERLRRPSRRGIFARAEAAYAAAHRGGDGRLPATIETIWLTGWAPGPDQPEPKRPGSATARLADALGVPERPAGDKAGT
ncbi:MAG: methyltransferase domain-containing protein [Pseudomonadota bacterium]